MKTCSIYGHYCSKTRKSTKIKCEKFILKLCNEINICKSVNDNGYDIIYIIKNGLYIFIKSNDATIMDYLINNDGLVSIVFEEFKIKYKDLNDDTIDKIVHKIR